MGKDYETAQHGEFQTKDYHDPPQAPLFDTGELIKWSFYRAVIAEFIATLLFLYVTVLTVIGYKRQSDVTRDGDHCGGVGILSIAWAFGGMIFILVYCTAGISGGHINPAVTFGLFLARKVSLVRALLNMVAQSFGAMCGVGLVKGFQKAYFSRYGGGANEVQPGYSNGVGLAAEIIFFGCWLHFPLDLLCSWFILPQSQSLVLELTLPGVLELPSSTTRIKHGMTNGSFGLDHSLEQLLLHSTTNTF